MAHLPPIVSDLAMILLVAGITTILFKKLNQPLVLGYIVAGFITGPHFSFFPTVTDFSNIHTWSEIGIIFLMFSLGLEFSFNKLKQVGSTAFIATIVEIAGLLSLGYGTGMLMGWSHMNSLFLGGMLSMSSTTIIIKAFEDLKMKGKRFTEMVFGILIVEDIAGIIMMVLLSTMAASAGISGTELLTSVMRLLFFLVLWFVLGIYLVPTFYKRSLTLMNNETMLEHLFTPVKDIFGAVFFVSVGMLVDPALLLEYWLPIIILIFVTIIGKLVFSAGGVLLSGQSLQTSILCGFSLAQIGEFSFIIASLGMSLGVISDFIYPIIVAVSVMTTFTTPFCIMAAEPAYRVIRRLLPQNVNDWLDRYTEKNIGTRDSADWTEFLKEYFTRMLIFTTLLTAIALFAEYYLSGYLHNNLQLPYADIITAVLTFIIMAPLLRAVLVNRTSHPELFSALWFQKRSNHIPLVVLILLKVIVAAGFIFFVFAQILGLAEIFAAAATLVTAYFISSSDWLMGEYLRMESRFLVNLNERHMRKHREALKEAGEHQPYGWFDEDLQLAHYKVEDSSATIGKTLLDLQLRKAYGCNVLQAQTPKQIYDMPGADFVINAGTTLLIIGTKAHFKLLNAAIENKNLGWTLTGAPTSMREFMLLNEAENRHEHAFLPCAITIDKHSPLLGKSIKSTDIRNKWHCLVIALERGSYTIVNPNISLVFEKDDLLWILGKQKMINQLVRDEIL